jgi:hypothetical protein
MEETNMGGTEPAKMPQFLKVLCILSFIGTGIMLIMGIVNYLSLTAMAAMGSMGGSAGEMGQAMNSMVSALDMDYGKMATSALVAGVINIPIFLGAFMMWKRKRIGFFIYAIFEIGQAIVPVFVIGGFTGIITTIFYALIAIAFIIMYGVNLKHMSLLNFKNS